MDSSPNLLYSLRLLRRNLSFVAICILVMSLGIALSITMYSVITSIAYKDIPFPNGDKYVAVHKLALDTGNINYAGVDSYTYQYLEQTEFQNFNAFGAVAHSNVTLSDGDIAEQFFAANISPNLLQITATEPLLGRSLLSSDDVPGAAPVVLLSYELWQNYYSGATDIVGSTSRINSSPYTIVGVMPEGFAYPRSNQLWLPLQLPANVEPSGVPRIGLLGVLESDSNLEAATAEVNSALLQLGERLPEFYSNQGATVLSYTRSQVGPMITYHMMTVMTFLILLLVCLNVANLLVVRTNERVQELAIRSALGASRWRLVQAVLLDSLLICVLGLFLGIIFADLGMEFVRSIMLEVTGVLPFWMIFDWELGTGLSAILIVLVIWGFSGGLAVWQVLRQDINTVISGGNKGAVSSDKLTGSAVLVSFEIIFSCFLLIVCGVFIGTTSDLTRIDYGTATEGYLTGRISLPTSIYPDNESQNLYRQNLEQELMELPGVEDVSFVTALPSQYGVESSYNLEDRDLLSDDQYPSEGVVWVAPDYFELMQVQLLAGRDFDNTDTFDSLPVVIVGETFAARFWPDQSDPHRAALGQRILINPQFASPQWVTIVGVASHIIQKPPQDTTVDEPSLYLPFTQNSYSQQASSQDNKVSFSVVMKVNGNPQSYREGLQVAAVEVNRDIPITDIYELSEVLAIAGAVIGFLTKLFSNISFVALVLAVTGIYAIVSRSVKQRTTEIGVRRALGSSDRRVLWVFVRQGFQYLFIGLLIGGGSAVLVSNAMAGLFIGLEKWLPLVFSSVSLGLGMLIFVAAYNPARKLVSIEPGSALRNE